MSVLKNLQPERVFYYFEELCRIPHGSGNTKEISDYLVGFAEKHQLRYIQDASNNVVIYKSAYKGYEDAPVVILQGHMDMVCEKTADSNHDFKKDGLDLFVEGDYVGARNTTLGADDGIALAYCLALLESDTYEHPALEVVFTVDEEVGLLGAAALDYSSLSGRIMINLDSEEEGELTVSCAGGIISTSKIPVRYQECEGMKCELKITGLTGGHSGAEIHKYRANADVLMGRLLYSLADSLDIRLSELEGGSKETAITRECRALILADGEEIEELRQIVKKCTSDYRREYAGIDENLDIQLSELGKGTEPVLHPVSFQKVVFYLMNVPNSVQKMSGVIENLVETSSNIGKVMLDNTGFTAASSTRSSVESARDAVADRIRYLTEFLGGEYTASGSYPSWEYQVGSPLQTTMAAVYEKLFGEKPVVKALHAGLECGLFYKGLPGLDCVSMGPDIYQIHTTEERLSISSAERNFQYLLELLRVMK